MAMTSVTINRYDVQPQQWCEQCGASPSTITVIGWAAPFGGQIEPRPQQSHHYCGHHAEIAERVWNQLRTAKTPAFSAHPAW